MVQGVSLAENQGSGGAHFVLFPGGTALCCLTTVYETNGLVYLSIYFHLYTYLVFVHVLQNNNKGRVVQVGFVTYQGLLGKKRQSWIEHQQLL